jgi:hypothetical protein
MAWSEKWRDQDRPEAGKIPDEYSLVSTVSDNKMIGYFIGVIGFTYVALEGWGSQSVLIVGIPLLAWLTVGVSALIIIGLNITVSQTELDEAESQMPMEQEVNDD